MSRLTHPSVRSERRRWSADCSSPVCEAQTRLTAEAMRDTLATAYRCPPPQAHCYRAASTTSPACSGRRPPTADFGHRHKGRKFPATKKIVRTLSVRSRHQLGKPAKFTGAGIPFSSYDLRTGAACAANAAVAATKVSGGKGPGVRDIDKGIALSARSARAEPAGSGINDYAPGAAVAAVAAAAAFAKEAAGHERQFILLQNAHV